MVGLDVAIEEKDDERIVRYEAPDRTLTERWSLGPDGDRWQVEWPVKGLKDFLVKTYSQKQFETAVLEAARQAMEDSRVILGIADRVSVNAEFARLKATTQLIIDAGMTYAYVKTDCFNFKTAIQP